MKPCRMCKRIKPLEEFPRDTRYGMAYRRPTCKDCCAPGTKIRMREERR